MIITPHIVCIYPNNVYLCNVVIMITAHKYTQNGQADEKNRVN